MPAGLPQDADAIGKYSTWFLVYGIVLVILGAIAVIAPGVATIAVELTVAWLLLIGGVLGLVTTFTAGTRAPGYWWNLVTAIVYVVAGVALLWSPIAGELTLTIIIAAYLLATGIAKVVLALRYRETISSAWGWMLLSGLVDGVLGIMIIGGLPLTGLWILGLLVGINLVFTGVALIMTALHARSLAAGGHTVRHT